MSDRLAKAREELLAKMRVGEGREGQEVIGARDNDPLRVESEIAFINENLGK